MNEVNKFLKRFHLYDNIDEAFTNGCCYWFASILFSRFIREGATIMHDKATSHFGTKIKGRVYDITGDVTDNYNWITWQDIDDRSYRAIVVRDRIMI